MTDRKKTPDILADLLDDNTGKTTESAVKTANGSDVLPVKSQTIKTLKPRKSKTATSISEEEMTAEDEENTDENVGKAKITFYLSEDSVELLEDAQRILRRIARKKGHALARSATSKSALLELTLRLACADVLANGEQSQLASKVF